MANRYQDRPFPAEDDFGGGAHASAKGDGDPLAELARLIGQTDPFGTIRRANLQVQPRATTTIGPIRISRRRRQIQRQTRVRSRVHPHGCNAQQDKRPRHRRRPEDYPSAVHPLHRYAAAHAAPEADYDPAPPFADADHERDLSRYDDALYGEPDSGAAAQHDPAYADDAYAYQESYGDGEADVMPKRRGGMVTVVAVLALAVFGVGGAFAYRTYTASARSGEPPIIRADAGPTKIIPAPTDGTAKLPDRLASGDGTEKIVPREEAPVDVNARSAPRVIFPPLSQKSAVEAVSVAPPANSGNGTLANNEPRKIRTLSVRGDPADPATPAAATLPGAAKLAAAEGRWGCPANPVGGQCQCGKRQYAAFALAAGRPTGGGASDPGCFHQPASASRTQRRWRQRWISCPGLLAEE